MHLLKQTFLIAALVLVGFGCNGAIDSSGTTEGGSVVDSGSTAPTTVIATPTEAPSDVYALFSLNVQDFSYPELSAETVNRVIDIHETYQVPVDIYLTSTIVDLYEEVDPDLITRLRTSPVVAISYHVRPPYPYHSQGYDLLGWDGMSAGEMYDAVMNYETHEIDLTTGEVTDEAGGYAYLKELFGYAPYVVGSASQGEVARAVNDVYTDLGAQFIVAHSQYGVGNLGATKDGLYLRPEHYDLKLFAEVGKAAEDVVTSAFDAAITADGARAPWFVGIKMHDNDFFAEDSAWVTVYLAKGARKGPPYNTDLQSALLSDADAAAQWELYEETVAYVSEHYQSVNAPGLLQLLAAD